MMPSRAAHERGAARGVLSGGVDASRREAMGAARICRSGRHFLHGFPQTGVTRVEARSASRAALSVLDITSRPCVMEDLASRNARRLSTMSVRRTRPRHDLRPCKMARKPVKVALSGDGGGLKCSRYNQQRSCKVVELPPRTNGPAKVRRVDISRHARLRNASMYRFLSRSNTRWT